MELRFNPESHTYESIDDPKKIWTSATTLIKTFVPPFEKEKIAAKVSKNKKSKWFGMDPKKIVQIWDGESDRAIKLGNWYHDRREQEVAACETIQRDGVDLPIFSPLAQDGIKISPDQQLVPGIYPEHFVYLKSANVCGQADRVEVVKDVVNIYDYKTGKEIKTKAYTNWEGVTNMLLSPLDHVEDCNLMHYALQLSLYMYVILKHNHSLKPGKLVIHHIVFEIEHYDDHGYPIVATDTTGDPIVEEVVPYEVPYMKKEINTILKYMKLNPHKFKHGNKTI